MSLNNELNDIFSQCNKYGTNMSNRSRAVKHLFSKKISQCVFGVFEKAGGVSQIGLRCFSGKIVYTTVASEVVMNFERAVIDGVFSS